MNAKVRRRGPSESPEHRRWVARQRHYGRWQPFVDAGPVRAHLAVLIEAGATLNSVADLAEVPYQTLVHVWRGRYGEPSKKIRPATAEAVLALTPAMFAPVSTGDPVDEAILLVRTGRADVPTAAALTGLQPESVLTSLRRRARKAGPASRDADLYREIMALRKDAGIEAATLAARARLERVAS